MRSITALMTAAAMFASEAASAQSIADRKAEADLALVQANINKTRLDALASIRAAAAGAGATMAASEKSAEALMLKYAVFRGVTTKLVARFKTLVPAGPDVHPIVVVGTTPPSVSHWLAFDATRRQVARNLIGAAGKWNKAAHPGKMAFVPAGIILTTLSALRTDTAVAGAALSMEDARLAAMITEELTPAYGVDYDDLRPGKTGEMDEKDLLGGETGAYDILTNIMKVEYPAAVSDATKNGGKIADELEAAIKDVQTAASDFEKLRDGLYADVNGKPLATVIVREKLIASDDGGAFPIIYVTSQEAALTTITRKNLFTGLGSTPATLSAGVVITYAVVGRDAREAIGNNPEVAAVRDRGTLSCVIDRRKFDGALAYPVDNSEETWSQLCLSPQSITAMRATNDK